MVVNDEPLGRNFDEVIRIVEGYQFFKENGQVCPAGWQAGEDGFTPGAGGNLNEYLSENASKL
jgi:peroxiredoxin (alkyl hydroperoxide reductase subunit C)